MSHPEIPSHYHPDLQEERLAALAQFFASARLGVVSRHDPAAGDDGWSLGCRGFSWVRNGLLRKVQSNDWPWLSIINPGKKFVFGIGSVPIRFFRGSMKRPPGRTLSYSAPELAQLALAFDDEQAHYRDLKWRFAIETGFLGEPTGIIFAGLAGDEYTAAAVVCQWKIPFTPDMIAVEPATPCADDMIDLPAPRVWAPRHDKGASNDAS